MQSPLVTTLVAICSMTCAAATLASEVYFDVARVLASEPVYEDREFPVEEQSCGYEQSGAPVRVDSSVLGDVRSSEPSASLVDAFGTDIALRQPAKPVYRCRMVTRARKRETLIGYRVRYEYGGRTYERQVKEPPGDTIRVRVRLNAGRADWNRTRAATDAQ